jgi:ParB family chromosome partitioning protein
VAVSNLLRLLDLPDDILDLLERRELTEGHGRALLLAEDHADRRRLGREAAQEGWTVRVLEAKAREVHSADGGRPARRSGGVHPDQAAAASEVGEALGRALGVEVRVRPTAGGGYRAELSFEDAEQAHELAARLAAGRA